MAGPLDGIRVLEMTEMITGPLAGMMLSDLGADVVKVERPDGGDAFRSFRGGNYSAHFCAYNRNKRSVVLDLKSDLGRRLALDLVRRSDIMIVNFRPGVMDRLNLSYDTIKQANPNLIYCAISGFGEAGPYKERPCYDAVALATSGLASQFVDAERPRFTGPTISDNITGYTACYGILGALFERQRTGIARRIDVNMLEATMAFAAEMYHYYHQMNLVVGPTTRSSASQSFAFRCADQKLLAVHVSSQEKFWPRFADAMECAQLVEDPRFKTRGQRISGFGKLSEVIGLVAETRPRKYWIDRLDDRDVPYAPINTVAEVFADEHIGFLGSFFDVRHSEHGHIRGVRRPVLFDGGRQDQPLAPPPAYGEHTDDILRELGCSKDDIDRACRVGAA